MYFGDSKGPCQNRRRACIGPPERRKVITYSRESPQQQRTRGSIRQVYLSTGSSRLLIRKTTVWHVDLQLSYLRNKAGRDNSMTLNSSSKLSSRGSRGKDICSPEMKDTCNQVLAGRLLCKHKHTVNEAIVGRDGSMTDNHTVTSRRGQQG